ncbi:hypothetical protein SB717_38295, partial [Priestia sp. SIMBA_032]|uniref:hypothetical protein n=1 Tax=Priestia sp. SIMBA_032 TaxID=3085775 RepID=UPI00397C0540
DLIDEKYKNYFRVYAFDLASKEAAGNVQTIGKHSACIYSNRSDTTLAHEVCHGLGLFHSHPDGVIKDANQKYIYPYAGSTST